MKKSLGFIATFKDSKKNGNNFEISFMTVIGTKKEVMKFKDKKDFEVTEYFEGDCISIVTSLDELTSMVEKEVDLAFEDNIKYCFDDRLKKLLPLYYRSINAQLVLFHKINFQEIYTEWFVQELGDRYEKGDIPYLMDYLNTKYEKELKEALN
jgi:hypothetical protein